MNKKYLPQKYIPPQPCLHEPLHASVSNLFGHDGEEEEEQNFYRPSDRGVIINIVYSSAYF